MAMAVLQSRDIKHGPLEVLVTMDEETGMTGARELKPGLLNGEILLILTLRRRVNSMSDVPEVLMRRLQLSMSERMHRKDMPAGLLP